ncbi:MAG: M14 family metallopeptidase [Bdellovibrionales bacterium]
MLKNLIFIYLLIFSVNGYSSLDLFDKDYSFLRERFKNNSISFLNAHPSARLGKIVIDSKSALNLTTDYLYFEPTVKNKLIIISSGTHGAEAKIGSYAQNQFLNKYAHELNLQDTGLLLIHGVNPYGFATGRRVDEQNRDLNRNFTLDNEVFEFQNKPYENLDSILNPTGAVGSITFSFVRMLGKVVNALTIGGVTVNGFRQASVGGQYHKPTGIYFGGTSPAQNVFKINELFQSTIPGYKKIMHLDFHTGLGESGQLHLIINATANSKERESIKQLFPRSDQKFYQLNTGESEGFYEVKGDFTDFAKNNVADKDAEVYGLTAEFGTMGLDIWNQLKTIHIIIQENQGHHFGYESKDLETEVRANFSELFNPSTLEWRNAVAEKIHHLFSVPVKEFSRQEIPRN